MDDEFIQSLSLLLSDVTLERTLPYQDELNEVERILKKPMPTRSPQDHQLLLHFLKTQIYFEECFDKLGYPQTFKMISLGKIIRIKRKTVIVKIGQHLDGLYVLLNGVISQQDEQHAWQPFLKGAAIGENELIRHQAVTFTCRVTTNSEFWFLAREQALQFIDDSRPRLRSEDSRSSQLRRNLEQQFDLLNMIARHDANFLLQNGHTCQLKYEEKLFSQGQALNNLYFILSGEFHCLEYYDQEKSKNKRMRSICIVGQGNILGFPDALVSDKYLCTTLCISKKGGKVWQLHKQVFLLRVNYFFNRRCFIYMRDHLFLKSTDNYSKQLESYVVPENKDSYSNMNHKFVAFLNQSLGKNQIKESVMDKISFQEQVKNMHVFKRYADQHPQLTRFRVESLINKKLLAIKRTPPPRDYSNFVRLSMPPQRARSQNKTMSSKIITQNINRSTQQSQKSFQFYDRLFQYRSRKKLPTESDESPDRCRPLSQMTITNLTFLSNSLDVTQQVIS